MLKKKLKLSKREAEVVEDVSQGMTSPEIGKALHISRKTVDFHLSQSAGKLHTKTRAHTVGQSIRTHEIDGVERGEEDE